MQKTANKNTLDATHPRLAAQWHPTKNERIPSEITQGSKQKVWWLGDCGHSWEAIVKNRARGSGCPYCANYKVLSGFNDLATTYPDIAAQWHPTLNLAEANQIIAGSKQKMWWMCDKGHEWETTVNNRTSKNRGCPYCVNQKVIPSFNSLIKTHPDIAAQWHPTENKGLHPSDVSSGSNRKVWWECAVGHAYQAKVGSKVRQKSGCNVCSGRTVLKTFNDLQSKNPELSAQWHPTKNILKPYEVTLHSNSKVWWMCDRGHEWEARVADRVSGRGCGYCSNRKIIPGFNDVATTHPEMLLEWSNSNTISPNMVTAGSGSRIKWECSEGHNWEAQLNDRVFYQTNCPVCTFKCFSSQAEKQIQEFIQNIQPTMQENTRTIIPPFEIDLYLPELKIGIEYNGLYWHSEANGKHRNYHEAKWSAAKEAGVQLIQVWEDDWKRNPELVKHMLAHKLGVSQERAVYARKTVVAELSKNDTETFLNQYHIQGHSNGSYYLGLRDNEKDEIVAVLVLKKEAGTDGRTLNIIRYATSCNVAGGFTKLLKYAERTYSPKSFITFADHCVSDGGLYENNGFVADKELKPDYTYLVRGERKHKFGYRLKRFRNDPTLEFKEGLTERELAVLNSIPRIWDAGKTRYVKKLDLQ